MQYILCRSDERSHNCVATTEALPRGRAKQDVTYIRMMHYTGTLPTFARFLRRELYALSANRNISSRDFPETVVAGLWPTSRIHVQPARAVSRPFIFGATTAWIVITFEKAVHVSRARRPGRVTGREGTYGVSLGRTATASFRGMGPWDASQQSFRKKKRETETDKCRILCVFFLPFRYIPPEDVEERLKLPALSKASTLRIMAHFVSRIVRRVNVRKKLIPWNFRSSNSALVLYIITL